MKVRHSITQLKKQVQKKNPPLKKSVTVTRGSWSPKKGTRSSLSASGKSTGSPGMRKQESGHGNSPSKQDKKGKSP